jgi:CRISPR system Cascade subunit CasD
MISNRYFLSDGVFLSGFEGPFDLLESIHSALENPVWPLFLGRKSYVPSEPFFLKDGLIRDIPLDKALLRHPLLIGEEELNRRLKPPINGMGKIRMVFESDTPTHESRYDQPQCFALGRRKYSQRFVISRVEDIALFNVRKEANDVLDAIDA